MRFKDITKNILGVSYNNRKGMRYFRASYKNNDVYKRKTYHCKKHGVRNAFQKAINFRKKLEMNYGKPYTYTKNKDKLKVRNVYEIKQNYFWLIVVHKEKNKSYKIKFSLEDLEEVQKHYWYLDVNGNTAGESISTWDNNKDKYISEILFPDKDKNEKINHKNRNTNDFTRNNIFIDDVVRYMNAHTYEESNTAPPGVCITKSKGLYWKAGYWAEGKQKMLSVKKFGYEKAKQMAIQKRKEWEKKFGGD
ncbi:MAG: hypothetical protein ACQEQF_07035 [Bacillota bacterium]